MAPDLVGRFARLEKAVEKLSRVKEKTSKDEFLSNDDTQDIVEHNFHIAVEAIIDLANHLISERAYRKPESNSEIFEILSEEGIIEEEFGKRLADWVRFRNILVHNYADVKPERVYEILIEELDDLRRIAAILADELKLT